MYKGKYAIVKPLIPLFYIEQNVTQEEFGMMIDI